jgi:hypothetical protein
MVISCEGAAVACEAVGVIRTRSRSRRVRGCRYVLAQFNRADGVLGRRHPLGGARLRRAVRRAADSGGPQTDLRRRRGGEGESVSSSSPVYMNCIRVCQLSKNR